jgi:hypothetical protein
MILAALGRGYGGHWGFTEFYTASYRAFTLDIALRSQGACAVLAEAEDRGVLMFCGGFYSGFYIGFYSGF